MRQPLHTFLIVLGLVCGLLLWPLQAGAQQSAGGSRGGGGGGGQSVRASDIAYTSGRPEYIAVGPQRQVAALARALTQGGARVLRTRDLPSMRQQALVVDLQDGLSFNAMLRLARQVAPQTGVDRHMIYRYAGSPRLYAPAMLGQEAGKACPLGRAVPVGLIDGPVDPGHPALARAQITRHSVLDPGDGGAKASHGTAVAGLIVGQDASGALGGFAPGARLYAVAAFAREKGGEGADVERIALALDWLLGRGVRLINMSFAGPPNDALAVALDAAARRGAVMVAASGNDGKAVAAFPAAAPQVIAVTAVDAARRRYARANYGPYIEFAAPGVDLFVARSASGGYASGTSYAAPIVTALAARLMARGAGSLSSVRAGLRKSAADLGDKGRDPRFGWGMPLLPGC
ncbi:MAG: S8 family serine peptidase [Paracoccaceae bacterium]